VPHVTPGSSQEQAHHARKQHDCYQEQNEARQHHRPAPRRQSAGSSEHSAGSPERSGDVRVVLANFGLLASCSHVAAISSIARFPSGSSMMSATCLAASACCCQYSKDESTIANVRHSVSLKYNDILTINQTFWLAVPAAARKPRQSRDPQPEPLLIDGSNREYRRGRVGRVPAVGGPAV